ncbi:MAG: hypothetical protein HXY24_12255 [Rubrivivax sp.]|nr:hypothetical protein [Rubrivivax sp.]
MSMKYFLVLVTTLFLIAPMNGVFAQGASLRGKAAMGPGQQEGRHMISGVMQQGDTIKIEQEVSTEERADTPNKTYWLGVSAYILITVLVLMAFILIPFLPGLIELFRPRDEKPLVLNMNFSKDYKYFGKSFQKLLEDGLGTKHITEPGEYTLLLSKPEKVRVVERKQGRDKETIDEILYVLTDFASGNGAEFRKEVYVRGSCKIGERNTLRALYCEGDLVIGEGTIIVRWVDGDKDIEVREGCRLGVSVASPKRLDVARHCTFSRMFGLPILTYRAELPKIATDIHVRNISDMTMVITKKEIIFPPGTTIPSDIVTHQGIVFRGKSFVKANIKSYHDIIIEEGSRVEGNLFSERDVVIEPGCTIMGNIFSQGQVKIGNAVRVGQEGQIKSVIAKKGVFIEGNVSIFGYLMTEGEGRVL